MKHSLLYLTAAICLLASPAVSHADSGSKQTVKGDFVVSMTGKRAGVYWYKTIKDVVKISFGRNFVFLETKSKGGYSFHQSTIDELRWEPQSTSKTSAKSKAKAPGREESLKKNSQDVDELFKEIEKLIGQGDYAKLSGHFKKLGSLIIQYENDMKALSKEERAQWYKTHGHKIEEWNKSKSSLGFEQIKRALALQVFTDSGNALLAEMIKNFKGKLYGNVIRAFMKLEKLCKATIKENNHKAFKEQAKSALELGRQLRDQALEKLQNK
jgi:hypothetical protein